MPRPEPHPLALFSLKPNNPRAHDVVAHPSNSHLVSILPDADGALALDVGFNIRSQSRNTLATLGRSDTDIIVEGSSIGRVQCSFEIDLDSRVVMLYDRSNGQTTQVSGDNATPFEHGRLRRVVVQQGLNTVIGMGGVGCDLVQFELIWYQDPVDTVEKVKSQEGMPCSQEENPRHARTVDEAPTVLPSQRVTRIHTPGERKLRMRYEKVGDPLGSGQFGTVHKCIDADSGKFMAVKILKRPARISKQEEWRISLYYALKREVETLSEISHVSMTSSTSYTP
jgi:hypothetical protein